MLLQKELEPNFSSHCCSAPFAFLSAFFVFIASFQWRKRKGGRVSGWVDEWWVKNRIVIHCFGGIARTGLLEKQYLKCFWEVAHKERSS
mmetsp:Transcript_1959/g.3025  ORF Transcript_1959/g.3025 Transcript_1959/m.3025 type:complete len:89 (-) Transcript_1959:282-548(-)